MTKRVKPSPEESTGNVIRETRLQSACTAAWLSVAQSGNRHPVMHADFWLWTESERNLRMAAWRQQHDARRETARKAEAALSARLTKKSKPLQRRLPPVGKELELKVLRYLIEHVEGTVQRGPKAGQPGLGATRTRTLAKNNPFGLSQGQVMDVWLSKLPERVRDNDEGWARQRAETK